jgi:hypothetical protein
MLSDERLREIEEREKAATQGPWELTMWVGGFVFDTHNSRYEPPSIKDKNGEPVGRHASFNFIAHARQDIPDLLTEVRRLRGRLKLAEGVVEAAKEMLLFGKVCDCEWEDGENCEWCRRAVGCQDALAAYEEGSDV